MRNFLESLMRDNTTKAEGTADTLTAVTSHSEPALWGKKCHLNVYRTTCHTSCWGCHACWSWTLRMLASSLIQVSLPSYLTLGIPSLHSELQVPSIFSGSWGSELGSSKCALSRAISQPHNHLFSPVATFLHLKTVY